MNGLNVTNQPLRTTQPTHFKYTPGSLTNHTGAIGLGGIARFAVSGGGTLLFGDFTLAFDPTRWVRGGSGWFLKGNLVPAATAFDLVQVQLTESPDSFTLAGRLAVSFEVANFLFATPADTLREVGNFRFVGYNDHAERTAPVIQRVEIQDDTVILQGTRGLQGGTFHVLSSSDGNRPSAQWEKEASGNFDSNGNFLLSLPRHAGDSSRWYRLETP
jgi:hypothetical protein